MTNFPDGGLAHPLGDVDGAPSPVPSEPSPEQGVVCQPRWQTAGRTSAAISGPDARCPDCDRPLATTSDSFDPALNPDDGDGTDALCWRHWNQGAACDGQPVDWRSRALEAERERDDWCRSWRVAADAHADAASVLEQVAAERDRFADALHVYETNHGARCDAEQERYATIAESACRMLSDVRERLEWAMTTNGRRASVVPEVVAQIATFLSFPSHEVPGLRAQVAARDRALDACADRIKEVLAEADALRGDLSREQRFHASTRDGAATLKRDLTALVNANQVQAGVSTARINSIAAQLSERPRLQTELRAVAEELCAALKGNDHG